MSERWLAWFQVKERLRISRSTFNRWMKKGIAPEPVPLTGRIKYWRESDIEAFLVKGKEWREAT